VKEGEEGTLTREVLGNGLERAQYHLVRDMFFGRDYPKTASGKIQKFK